MCLASVERLGGLAAPTLADEFVSRFQPDAVATPHRLWPPHTIGPIIIATLTYTGIVYICGHVKFAEYLRIQYIKDASEIAVASSAVLGRYYYLAPGGSASCRRPEGLPALLSFALTNSVGELTGHGNVVNQVGALFFR